MVDHQNKQSHIPQPVSQDAKIHYDLQIFLRGKRKAIPLERNVNLRKRYIMARKRNFIAWERNNNALEWIIILWKENDFIEGTK